MRYMMSSQWSLMERFDITDASGTPCFEARGHFGKRITLHDASGQQVAEITKRPFSETHEVYVGGDLAAQVKHTGFFGDQYQINSAFGVFEARGRLAGWDFTLTQGGMPVATMDRHVSFRETFAVDIADNENAAFVFAVLIAIEAIHDERARRR